MIVFAMLVAACGSDSKPEGVDPDLELSALSAAQITEECTFVVSNFPSKSAMCGGLMVTVNDQTESQCEAMIGAVPDTCTVTVGTSEDCLSALEADPCNGMNDAACTALFVPSCM